MRINFSDGYIDLNPKGNTYCGNVAHELMYIAQKNAREFHVDYQYCLEIAIKTTKELINQGHEAGKGI
jgi:hypothetical protein